MSDILTAPAPEATAGTNAAPATPAAAGDPAPEATPATDTGEPKTTKVPRKPWMSMLPHEYKDDEAIGAFDSFEDFMGDVAANKTKIDAPILPEDATPEQEAELFAKLGTPEAAEGYELSPDVFPEQFRNDEFMGQFAKVAHDAHLTQSQLTLLAAGYGAVQQEAMDRQAEVESKALEVATDFIVKEKGFPSAEAAQPYVQKLRGVMSNFFGVEGSKVLTDAGLSNNVEVIRAVMKMEKNLSESSLKTGSAAPKTPEPQTPAQQLYGKDPNMVQGTKEMVRPEVTPENAEKYKQMYGS